MARLVGSLARVDPLVVDVYRLRQVVDGALEVLVAHTARHAAHVTVHV